MASLKIDVVCRDVPVVTLDKDGDALAQFVYTNAAGMLQQCFGSCSSADSLYSYVEEKNLERQCEERGYRRENIMIGKSIPSSDGTPVYGVGNGHKRILLFAMVVALALRRGKEYRLLKTFFEEYDKERRYAYSFFSLLDGVEERKKGNGAVPRIKLLEPLQERTPARSQQASSEQPTDAQRHMMTALRQEAKDRTPGEERYEGVVLCAEKSFFRIRTPKVTGGVLAHKEAFDKAPKLNDNVCFSLTTTNGGDQCAVKVCVVAPLDGLLHGQHNDDHTSFAATPREYMPNPTRQPTATGQPQQSVLNVDNQTTWDNGPSRKTWKDSSTWHVRHEDDDWKYKGKSSWQEKISMAGNTQTPRGDTTAWDTRNDTSWDSWRQSQAGTVAVRHSRTNWSNMFSSSVVEGKPVLFMNKSKQKQSWSDEDVAAIAYELDFKQLPNFRQQWNLRPLAPLNMDELDLGNQGLQDSGVTAILKAMMEHCVTVKVLKLYRNHISSAGREAVGALIAKAEKPPAEVHLSHNLLGPSDIWCLIKEAAGRKEYPMLMKGGFKHPLWLRVERQRANQWDAFDGDAETRKLRISEMVAYAEETVFDIRGQLGLLPTDTEDLGCFLCMPRYGERCRNFHCMQNHSYGPIIHLPSLWDQGVKFVTEEVVKQTVKDGYSHSPAPVPYYSAPSVPLSIPWKSGWASSQASGSSSALPFTRRGKKRVDKCDPVVLYESPTMMVLSKGAGWICKWNSYGGTNSKIVNLPQNHFADTRSAADIVGSGSFEHFDAYCARCWKDEMVQAWWEFHKNPQNSLHVSASSAGCVHRLDVGTSGCLMRAKNQKSFEDLKQQIHKHTVKKWYYCLAHSHVPADEKHVITARIATETHSLMSRIDEVRGEDSETRVQCLAHFTSSKGQKLSLCEVQILTGRTHQIRIHLSHKGWPLVRDEKYNPLAVYQDAVFCSRIFLHSAFLCFYDDNVWQTVHAPIPEDLHKALQTLTVNQVFGYSGESELFDTLLGVKK